MREDVTSFMGVNMKFMCLCRNFSIIAHIGESSYNILCPDPILKH